MSLKKCFVYIASPYTKGDTFVNVQRQIEFGNDLIDKGYVPVSLLLNVVHYYAQKEREYDTWLEIDYNWILKCDALFRLEGESKGADLEVAYAKKNNIPVFTDMECLSMWYLEEFAVNNLPVIEATESDVRAVESALPENHSEQEKV